MSEYKNIDKLKQIVAEHQYQKINGVLWDVVSANAALLVFNALKKENKKKFDEMITKNPKLVMNFVWKHAK